MRLDDDQIRRFRSHIEQQIGTNGTFSITTAAGMLVATKRLSGRLAQLRG